MTDDIFIDYRKGEKPSTEVLSAAFGTANLKDICAAVIEKGDLELSAAERKEATEKKRSEIVSYLHKYYTDPKAKTPHPLVRIENALDQIKFRVDSDQPADKQAQEAVKKIITILPMKKSEMGGTMSLPHAHLGSGASVLKKLARVLSENYTDTGCDYTIEFLPGDYQTLLSELGKVTGGDFNFVVDGMETSSAEAAPSNAKGHKGKPAKAAGGGKRK
jgi:ribosome maturation protein SDO1